MNRAPVFEQREIDGVRMIYAQTDWPQRIPISPGAFFGSPIITIDDNGFVHITVENGRAIYKLAKEQEYDQYALFFTLVNGKWEPIP